MYDLKLQLTQTLDLEKEQNLIFQYAKELAIPGTLKDVEKTSLFSSLFSSSKKPEEVKRVTEYEYEADSNTFYQA